MPSQVDEADSAVCVGASSSPRTSRYYYSISTDEGVVYESLDVFAEGIVVNVWVVVQMLYADATDQYDVRQPSLTTTREVWEG
jgi:hypothetical protein